MSSRSCVADTPTGGVGPGVGAAPLGGIMQDWKITPGKVIAIGVVYGLLVLGVIAGAFYGVYRIVNG